MIEYLDCNCPGCGVPYLVYCDNIVVNHMDDCTYRDPDLNDDYILDDNNLPF